MLREGANGNDPFRKEHEKNTYFRSVERFPVLQEALQPKWVELIDGFSSDH